MASLPDVLVTGSAGHLGCALMFLLPSLGYTPIGVDILEAETTTQVGSIADPTLHKPHVDSHSKADFVDVNITGTLNLLEESRGAQGRILRLHVHHVRLRPRAEPQAGRARRLDHRGRGADPQEHLRRDQGGGRGPVPPRAGADGHARRGAAHEPFLPEADDDADRRALVGDGDGGDENLKVLEMAYRRVDIADVVSACDCAMRKAQEIRWGKYVISAPPPFSNDPEILKRLDSGADEVYVECVAGIKDAFEKKGWRFLPRLDRVYDSSKAIQELGWQPQYTIQNVVDRLLRGEEWRSDITFKVGRKGYHAVSTGVYTVR
ncbi:oxidoreductase [Apiospora kogelbergensis]|uniref:oxidoreductase n=1 Tax=Apiospora kogelbergensis TaxID=1337665 RepID=UPI00312F2FC3